MSRRCFSTFWTSFGTQTKYLENTFFLVENTFFEENTFFLEKTRLSQFLLLSRDTRTLQLVIALVRIRQTCKAASEVIFEKIFRKFEKPSILIGGQKKMDFFPAALQRSGVVHVVEHEMLELPQFSKSETDVSRASKLYTSRGMPKAWLISQP